MLTVAVFLCGLAWPATAGGPQQTRAQGPASPTVPAIVQQFAQINLLRQQSGLVPLTPVEVLRLQKQQPSNVEAARLHAAQAFLADAGRSRAARLAGGDMARLELMAQRIVADTAPTERTELTQLAAALSLDRLATTLAQASSNAAEDPAALKRVLDDFFTARNAASAGSAVEDSHNLQSRVKK